MPQNRDTHFVTYSNLIDAKTGKPVRIEVPNTLVYEGKMLYAGFLGTQAGERVCNLLKTTKK